MDDNDKVTVQFMLMDYEFIKFSKVLNRDLGHESNLLSRIRNNK